MSALSLILDRLIELSQKAADQSEVPIAALIVKNGEIIAESINQTEAQMSFLAHAEINAIHEAEKKLETKHLNDCEMYVSVEPCKMCFAAAQLARLNALHYLIPNKKFGIESSSESDAYHAISLSQIHDSDRHEAMTTLLGKFFSLKRTQKT